MQPVRPGQHVVFALLRNVIVQVVADACEKKRRKLSIRGCPILHNEYDERPGHLKHGFQDDIVSVEHFEELVGRDTKAPRGDQRKCATGQNAAMLTLNKLEERLDQPSHM